MVANPSGVDIRIVEFYHKDVPERDAQGKETGKLVLEDWVKYGPPGALDRTVIPEAIHRLARVKEPRENDSPLMRMGWDLWQVIKPAYEKWKHGEEIPVDGTPLAAWTGVRRDHVEVFKKHGLRTVEEIAGLNDTMMNKIQLPGLRELKMQAQRFLTAFDQNRVAAQLKDKDDQIKALAANQEAMQEQIRTLLGQKPEESVKARVAENEEREFGTISAREIAESETPVRFSKPRPKGKGWPKGKKRGPMFGRKPVEAAPAPTPPVQHEETNP